MKLKNSLLTQYLLIILFAIMILPTTSIFISTLFYSYFDDETEVNIYQNGSNLEMIWHEEARSLAGASEQQINERLIQLKSEYPKASMYWVNESGETKFKLPENLNVPSSWSPSHTIDFMKKNRGMKVDPFTVVALIGENKNEGLMVLQVPRSEMEPSSEEREERYSKYILIAVLAILALFIFISWIFFYKIRKRLLRLQQAMTIPVENGIPDKISVERKDEIGQLELSFNEMIDQLKSSRLREREEEILRRRLIANLSHDLRTPLTTIRGHAFSLQKEPLSGKGKESLELIDTKINYLGQLIENLLSYTLLTSGKYPYHPKKTDIVRLVKTSFAAWYPVFENLRFQMDVDFPESTFYWEIDTEWMERILDNFYQNINRHAKDGQYISVKVDVERQQIIIADHGPGMRGDSDGKGAGIGLSIVSLMLKDMKLEWIAETGEKGTTITIQKRS